LLRNKRSMTQAQLAERCCMSSSAVCYLETGKSFPPKATVDRICRELEMPTAYLLLASIEEEDFPMEKRLLYHSMLEPLRDALIL